MVSTEHFISFGTDLGNGYISQKTTPEYTTNHSLVGIERILRGFQAICALLVWYPALFAFVENKVSSPAPLGVLGGQINVSRRFIRFFRFLDSFQAGWKAFVSQGNKGLDGWLEIVSKTCFGMFGMMETMTLLDLCGIENLRIFSVEKFAEIEYQGQLFWFAGLYTSIMVSIIRLFRLLFSPPAAVTKESVSTASTEDTAELVTAEKEASFTLSEKSSKEELDKERKRLKGIIAKRKAERGAYMQKLRADEGKRVRRLDRRLGLPRKPFHGQHQPSGTVRFGSGNQSVAERSWLYGEFIRR